MRARYSPEMTVALFDHPDGVRGIRATMDLMTDMARRYRLDPRIRHLAASLVDHLPAGNHEDEIYSLGDFVREDIRYLMDTAGVETIQEPPVTLDLGYGDCDDKCVLLASLLGAIGYETAFVAMALSSHNYDHVIVITRPPGDEWMVVDTTKDTRGLRYGNLVLTRPRIVVTI